MSIKLTLMCLIATLTLTTAFTPTTDVHLSCTKGLEYAFIVDCHLPTDLSRKDITKIISTNITTTLPIKIAAPNMPEHLPQGIGSAFPDLEDLRVWWAHVKFIDRESFSDLRHLRKLDLIGNEIETIPTDTFYDLENIDEINLYQNRLTTISADLLIKNLKLKKFSASVNQIEAIPSGLFRMNREIEWIDFMRNKIASVDVDFTELAALETVGLSSNVGECDFNFGMTIRNVQTIGEFQQKVNLHCRN